MIDQYTINHLLESAALPTDFILTTKDVDTTLKHIGTYFYFVDMMFFTE